MEPGLAVAHSELIGVSGGTVLLSLCPSVWLECTSLVDGRAPIPVP